jgi:hypothetical protein
LTICRSVTETGKGRLLPAMSRDHWAACGNEERNSIKGEQETEMIHGNHGLRRQAIALFGRRLASIGGPNSSPPWLAREIAARRSISRFPEHP